MIKHCVGIRDFGQMQSDALPNFSHARVKESCTKALGGGRTVTKLVEVRQALHDYVTSLLAT
jgi:hypothetical protein